MEDKETDEESVPPWLDRSFIASALNYVAPQKEESNIDKISVQKLNGGMLSETFRVSVSSRMCDDRRPVTSVIVKSLPGAEGYAKHLLDSGVFRRETVAYKSFLPEVETALKEVDGSPMRPVAPRHFHHGSHPVPFIVMEDLEASGFHKVPSSESLSLVECSAALRSLARIHAASVPMTDHVNYSDTLFQKSYLFNENAVEQLRGKKTEYIDRMLKCLGQYTWFRNYALKLQSFIPKMMSETVTIVNQCNVEFKVMVHGDFHKSNIMFRTFNDELHTCIFDFQGLHVGSPAEDLQFFLHSSASVEVLRDHTDLLLCEYHGTLQRTMRALGLQQQADAYPLDQLHKDMDHFGLVAVYSSFYIRPFIMFIDEIDFSLDSAAENQLEIVVNFYERCWGRRRYIGYLEHCLTVFDSKGYFSYSNN